MLRGKNSSTARAVCLSLCFFVCLVWCERANALVLDSNVILQQQAGVCAITFDDGPTQYTAALLDALREEGVNATFFVLGKQVQYRPHVVLRMVAEGHEVATHGFSHPNMQKVSFQAQRADLELALTQLRDMGIHPSAFRPPYGRYDDALAALADSLGLSLVMWTTDSRDWKRRPAHYRNLPSTSGRNLAPEEMRGVFLFHDTRPGTVEDIGRIITDLREIGCTRFVTLKEYIHILPPPDTLYAINNKGNSKGKGKGADKRAQTSPAPHINVATNTAGSMGLAGVADTTRTADAPHISLPAGTSPVPLARSSSPWIQPLLFRGGPAQQNTNHQSTTYRDTAYRGT